MCKAGWGSCVIIAFISIATFAAVAEAAGPDSAKAQAFVREGIARSMILFKEDDSSRGDIAQRIRAELKENFDIHTIAGYALGPMRKELNADQKQRYLVEFKDWLSETVVRFVMGLRDKVQTASPDILTLTGTTALGPDQILVHSRIRQSDGETAKVDWRLRLKENRFLVLDIIIFGVSQAEVFRSQFAALIHRQNRDIEGLIAELKQKNAILVKD